MLATASPVDVRSDARPRTLLVDATIAAQVERIVTTARSRTPLTPQAERLAPAAVEYRATSAGQHVGIFYGPGRSVRVVAFEHERGPVRTGTTVPAADVTTDAVTCAAAQVVQDAAAIAAARAS